MAINYKDNMASKTLEIILSAKDQASKTIKSLGSSLNGLVKESEGASIAFAGLITAVGVTSVKAFNDSEKSVAQLDAVLDSTKGVAGVTRKSILEMASALQKTTTYSDEAVLGAENLLLTFTNIGKNVFPQATQTVLDMSTALGQDLKSSSIQLGKALQDPILGVSALRRVGVNFSEDQKNVIEKLVKTGHALEAQQMILKELNTEFGGSASKAAQTFSGKMTILANSINDAQETLGKLLSDALKPFIENLIVVVPHINNMISALSSGNLGAARNQLMEVFGPTSPMIFFFDFVRTHGQEVSIIIGGMLVGALLGAASAMWAFIGPWLTIVAIAGGVAGAIALVVSGLETGNPIIVGAGIAVSGLAISILAGLVPALYATATAGIVATLATIGLTGPIIAATIAVGALVTATIWLVDQIRLLMDAQYLEEVSTRNLITAKEDLTIANQTLADAEDQTRSAMVRVESANLAVERATKNYTDALKAHGPKAIETREAANRLEQAKLGVKDAEKAVMDAANKEIAAQIDAANKSKTVEDAAKRQTGAFKTLADWIGNVISKLGEWASKKGPSGGGGESHQHGGFVSGSFDQAVPAILHGGERVIPRNGVDVNNSGGGGGVNLSLNFSGPVNMDSDSRVQELADKIIDILGRQNELASRGLAI